MGENEILQDAFSLASQETSPTENNCTVPPKMGKHPKGHRTTAMLHNLPNNYLKQNLLDMLDSKGFAGMYDFVYMPTDLQMRICFGFAFVNLIDTEVADKFWKTFDGFMDWDVPNKNVCTLSWSNSIQGF